MPDSNTRFKRMGGNLVPVNQDALTALHSVPEGNDVMLSFHPSDPAKMEAHRFLFTLLHALHRNWPGERSDFE